MILSMRKNKGLQNCFQYRHIVTWEENGTAKEHKELFLNTILFLVLTVFANISP